LLKATKSLYRAATPLPKAEGWQDCAAFEDELVANAPDCADLKSRVGAVRAALTAHGSR